MPDGGELHTQVEYRAAFDGLRRFFAGRGVPSEEAADLAQEALTRTFIHIKRHGRASEDLWPLLTTVARNLYSDRGRRGAPAVVPLSEAVELVDTDPTPDDLVLRRERRDAVRAAVASLPVRHRRAIELELRGLTPADIARELGIKRNAADALLHRARRSLASKLESMRGAFGALPLVIRLRSFARRSTATISRIDTSIGFATAATGIAAIAIVGALGTSAGSTHNAHGQGRLAASTATLAGVSHIARSTNGASATQPAAAAHGGTRLVTTTVGTHKVAAHVLTKDPATKQPSGVDLDAWFQPDGRRSVILGVIGSASGGACNKAGLACGLGK